MLKCGWTCPKSSVYGVGKTQGKQYPKQCCRTKSTSSYIVISLQLTKVSTAAAWLLFGLLYASMPLLDVGRKWLPHKPFNRAKKPPKCLQGFFFIFFRFRGFFVSPTFSLLPVTCHSCLAISMTTVFHVFLRCLNLVWCCSPYISLHAATTSVGRSDLNRMLWACPDHSQLTLQISTVSSPQLEIIWHLTHLSMLLALGFPGDTWNKASQCTNLKQWAYRVNACEHLEESKYIIIYLCKYQIFNCFKELKLQIQQHCDCWNGIGTVKYPRKCRGNHDLFLCVRIALGCSMFMLYNVVSRKCMNILQHLATMLKSA